MSKCLRAMTAVMLAAPAAMGQDTEAAANQRTLLDLIQAGGWVGYVILLLSVVGVACVVDMFLRTQREAKAVDSLGQEVLNLAQKRQVDQVAAICRMNDSAFSRIVVAGLEQGRLGVEAVREAIQQQGVKEVTRLRQRNGYIGLIATVSPMLGLLGTVVGMIASFQLLGEARGAARPDELALGISQALVTTCMGLILAVPLTFFYAYFRDRITRLGQDAATLSDRMLRVLTTNTPPRQQAAGTPTPAPHAQSAPRQERVAS